MAARSTGFASVNGLWANAPQDIDAFWHGFQMVRIDAGPNATQVVNLEFVRDWPYTKQVGQSMGIPHSRANSDVAIAVAFPCCPQPTGLCELDFRPEAINEFRGVKIGVHRKRTPFGAMLPVVNAARELSFESILS